MLTQPERTSTRLAAVLAAVAALVLVGILVSASGDDRAEPSASLEIDGTTYRFAPSTCTVTDSDFLAAGPGRIDGQDYWVSISSSGAELAFGTSDEMTRSDDEDDLWLRSIGEIAWDPIDDATVEADVTMGDARVAQSPQLLGHFVFSCPAV